MNCLRRTTVFGAESTAVNTIGNDGKEDKGVKGVFKENHAAVLAIKQEIVPFETANSKILATPSRAQERRDAQMIVTRTPGQRERNESEEVLELKNCCSAKDAFGQDGRSARY